MDPVDQTEIDNDLIREEQEAAARLEQVKFELRLMKFIRDEHDMLMAELDVSMASLAEKMNQSPAINLPLVRGLLKYFSCPKALMGIALGLFTLDQLSAIISGQDPNYVSGTIVFNATYIMNWVYSVGLLELLPITALARNDTAIDLCHTDHGPRLQLIFQQTFAEHHRVLLESNPALAAAIEEKRKEHLAKEEKEKSSGKENIRLQLERVDAKKD